MSDFFKILITGRGGNQRGRGKPRGQGRGRGRGRDREQTFQSPQIEDTTKSISSSLPTSIPLSSAPKLLPECIDKTSLTSTGGKEKFLG